MEATSAVFGLSAFRWTLPGLMSKGWIRDDTPVKVLVVHLRRAILSPELDGERLRVQVKYGSFGTRVRCHSHEDTASVLIGDGEELDTVTQLVAEANVCSTLFLLRREDFEHPLQFRLKLVGQWGTRTLAQASVPTQKWNSNGAASHSARLLSIGLKSREVGRLLVGVESLSITKRDLRNCLRLVAATEEGGAFVAGGVPIVQGVALDEDHGSSEGSLDGSPGSGESDEESAIEGEPLPGLSRRPGLRGGWRGARLVIWLRQGLLA